MTTPTPPLCPCCGQPVDPVAFLVDLNTSIAVVFGKQVRLSPQEAEILALLKEHHPNGVHRERIALHIYGRKRFEEMSQVSITSSVSRIRHRTRIGIRCRNHTYTLDLSGPEEQRLTPLRALRAKRNLTLRALSRASGISVTSLWEIEHGGTRKPSERTIARLAATLQVPIQALFPTDVQYARTTTCAPKTCQKDPVP